MKKLLFILLMLPAMLLAAPVDPNSAQQVAENFINAPETNVDGSVNKAPHKQKRMVRAAKEVADNQLFYIFNSEDADGYVIIAADNIATPVLGYSYSGSLDVDNMPDNLLWWLSEYEREIKWALAQGIEPTEDTKAEWEALSNTRKAKQADVIVAPLIKTEWSQGNGYYNKCPYDSQAGIHCVTGCVATAMAQIMKYWEHPIKGRGSHSYSHTVYGEQFADFGNTTYDWANMPNDLGLFSSGTEIDAIATLMYHCGVAVDMDYGVDESKAMAWKAENAFRNYFSYSDEARMCSKVEYTLSEWQSKLKVQLILGRPLFYDGRGSNGEHAFICDGFRSDDYFHFNWGWDRSDGYYSLSALNPSSDILTTQDFTSNQIALLCLYPKTNTSSRFILEMEDHLSLRDSMPVGEPWSFMAIISNAGDKKFDGYIYASVYNTAELSDGSHYKTDIIWTDSLYVDSLPGIDVFDFKLDSARNLSTGVYEVVMQYRDTVSGDLTPIRSDFYRNYDEVVVYNPLEMDLTAFFSWYGSKEHWCVGDSIKFTTQINNNESTPFTGFITMKLVNKSNPSIYKFFDDRDCSEDAIPAYGDAIVSVKGKLTTTPGEYDAYLLYKNNESEEWQLVGCTEGLVNPRTLLVEPAAEKNEYVILAQRQSSSNWYYLTSVNAGTESTPHLEAVNSSTSDKSKVQNYDLEDKYIWTIEETTGGIMLKNLDVYISYTSGNTAYMSANGKVLSVNNLSSGLTQYWFVDTSNATRYLSLNTTYDYFSFYKGTQAQDLLVLPYSDGPTTPLEDIELEETGTTKILRNGQILILRGDKVYTLQGQEVR